MSDQPIDIEISVSGADQAARGVDQVTRSLEQEARAADGAHDSTTDAQSGFASMARGGRELVQRVQGVAGSIQSVVSALGSRNRTAGLVASVAGATAQFAAMGSALGPGGAVIGGLAGFVTSLYSARDAAVAAGNAAMAAETAFESMGRSIANASRERARVGAAAGRNLLAAGDAPLTADEVTNMITGAEVARGEASARSTAAFRSRDGEAMSRASAEVVRLDAEIEGMRATLARIREAESHVVDLPTGVDAPTDPDFMNPGGSGGRGGGRRADPMRFFDELDREFDDEFADRFADGGEVDEMLDSAVASYEEYTDAIVEAEREKNDYLRDLDAERLESEREKQDYLLEMEREAAEARQEIVDAENEATKTKRRQALEEMVEQQQEFMQLGMNVVGMLTNALGEIASGEKNAEQAFKGLAKAFLNMISQYTALKAATEFADAIASFARYDYSGGAQHLAAGAAFTAVAVATGVGAAAIPSGASASAAARPQPSANDGSYGPQASSVTVVFNSPVMTAATQDDLAADLEAMIRVGRSRAA